MQPIARSGGSARSSFPPGSTDSTARPSNGPPCLWKYHQGMPFTAETIAVSGPNRGCIASATPGSECAFSVITT